MGGPIIRSENSYRLSECDSEASIMRWPWPTKGFCVMEKKYLSPDILSFYEPPSPSLTISSASVQMNKLLRHQNPGGGREAENVFYCMFII